MAALRGSLETSLHPKFHPQMGETPPGFHLLSSNAVNQEFGCNPRLGKSPYDQSLLPGRFRHHFFRSNDNTRDQFSNWCSMLVHFLTDEPTKIPAIRAILGPEYDVEPQVLGDGSKSVISNGVLMVDADLRKPAPVEQLKLVMHDLHDVSEKLFVVQKHLHHMVAQAFALGATSVVSRPKEIVSKLAEIEVAHKAAQAGAASASPTPRPRSRTVRQSSGPCSRRYGTAGRSSFRMPRTPRRRSSTASRKTG